MRRFRCSIAGLMALVLLAALDCMAIRSPLSGLRVDVAMLLLGGLPMANILALVLVPLLRGRTRHRGPRPSVVGFEVTGWATLLLYAYLASTHPEALRESAVASLGSLRAHGNAAFLAAVIVAILAPQVALALLGGWLNAKYDVQVTLPWPAPTREYQLADQPSGSATPRL